MKAVVRVALGQVLGEQAIRGPLTYPDVVASWLGPLGFKIIQHEVTYAPASQEGLRYWAMQNKAERNRGLASQAKDRNARRNSGRIKCEACGFQDREPSMFDAHHKKPLASTGVRNTRVKDLAVLCPTCHRRAHEKAGDRLHPLSVKQVLVLPHLLMHELQMLACAKPPVDSRATKSVRQEPGDEATIKADLFRNRNEQADDDRSIRMLWDFRDPCCDGPRIVQGCAAAKPDPRRLAWRAVSRLDSSLSCSPCVRRRRAWQG